MVRGKDGRMQFAKFGAVGILNTAIDFLVLNLMLVVLGGASGASLVFSNSVAFLVASANSYVWNRKWTFSEGGSGSLKQFSFFLMLTLGGVIINTLILFWAVNGLERPSGLSPWLWVNLAKTGATAASMMWNYLAYKHLLFKKAPLAG